ncbi:MAG: 5'-methylthioadenosine/S-adenosylhomocysteine nucleosidase [Patescibacteria group bacterium]|nr:5'-methylthioadenosine/S-adenosylhomocysteine nucleosidase [Patescibacteria group bacterium]
MIGIVCAMPSESEHIIQNYNLVLDTDHTSFSIYKNNQIALITTKIGKIAAAAGTQYILSHFPVDKVINVGIAGSLDNSLEPGDVVIGTHTIQHDAIMPWEGDHLVHLRDDMQLPHIIDAQNYAQVLDTHSVYNGGVATGDQFVEDKALLNQNKIAGKMVIEMEAFAVAMVCDIHNIPCLLLKGVSDKADGSATEDSEANIDLAMKNNILVLQSVITDLSK